MKIRVWLSYDLGVKGDYSNLWLDKYNALECGDSIATFFWESNDISTVKQEIKESLQEAVDFKTTDRVYLVFMKQNKYTGSFIFGKRKANPGAGCSLEFSEDDE
jgi:hypothetical protein